MKDIASFAIMLWKGAGRKLNLMCGKNDLYVFKYRLKAAGLATSDELVDRVPVSVENGSKEESIEVEGAVLEKADEETSIEYDMA